METIRISDDGKFYHVLCPNAAIWLAIDTCECPDDNPAKYSGYFNFGSYCRKSLPFMWWRVDVKKGCSEIIARSNPLYLDYMQVVDQAPQE